MAAGTKEDPWVLKTPPGSSEYTMYRDEAADPPALVCQVGSTTLRYHLRAIDDLHDWLVAQSDWSHSGRRMRRRRLRRAPSRHGAAPPTTRSAGGTAYAVDTGVVSGCTSLLC
jgi:hypothetical protein